MKKEHIRTIFECILVFMMVYIFNTFFYNNYDHIIDFTHCYSIANNLMPYKDFNIVVGPVYPVLISIFLRIFGKNFIVFHIVNSSFIVGIYLLIKKHNKKTLAIFAIACSLVALSAKYNLFTLLLFYIIYYVERDDIKYKDYIIGILLSILIFTKINVGCALILPTFILYYKTPKIILKRFISFIIISTIIIVTMFLYGVLPGFINYTVLGLISFSQNSLIDVCIIFLILAIIYIFKNIKKDKYLIYMLCYLIICYPLFETGHILIGIFPTFVYVIDKIKQTNPAKIKKYVLMISCTLFILFICVNSFRIHISFKTDVMSKIDCKKHFCSESFFINQSLDYTHKINNYLKEKGKEYRIYNFTYDAYFFKLDLRKNINKYDFIWNGNMGYKGEDTYIKEINDYCKNNKCMFIIDKTNIYKRNYHDTINLKILKFVDNNYNEIKDDKIFNKTIYSFYTND